MAVNSTCCTIAASSTTVSEYTSPLLLTPTSTQMFLPPAGMRAVSVPPPASSVS